MHIGLTGGIATGKSTVSKMFVERGAILIDADQIAREVVLPGSETLKRVAERFGQAVLLDNGELNRKKLGEIIFNDPKARKDLEAIMHPAIRQRMRQKKEQAERENPDKLVVLDVPLIYESNIQDQFDEVVLVYVPEPLQLKRLMARDGLTEEEARKRLRAQISIEEKKRLADYVIDNSGTLENTRRQVDAFWRLKGLS